MDATVPWGNESLTEIRNRMTAELKELIGFKCDHYPYMDCGPCQSREKCYYQALSLAYDVRVYASRVRELSEARVKALLAKKLSPGNAEYVWEDVIEDWLHAEGRDAWCWAYCSDAELDANVIQAIEEVREEFET